MRLNSLRYVVSFETSMFALKKEIINVFVFYTLNEIMGIVFILFHKSIILSTLKSMSIRWEGYKGEMALSLI